MQASSDMAAAQMETVVLLEANRLMAQRVADLEGQLGGGLGRREVELERELEQVGVGIGKHTRFPQN
jgi:hypothetical protein